MSYASRTVYASDDQSVDFFSNGEEHLHEEKIVEDENNIKSFIWNKKQSEIVRVGVKLRALPKVIKRNAFIAGRLPTQEQLHNKIAYEKRKLGACEDVFTSQELKRIAEKYT